MEQQRLKRPPRRNVEKIFGSAQEEAVVNYLLENPFDTVTRTKEESNFPDPARRNVG